MVVRAKERSLDEILEGEPFGGCTLRVRKARRRILNATPVICLERARIITEVFMKTEGEPIAIRKAKAFKELCEQGTIFIQEGELIVGYQAGKLRAGSPSPDSNHSALGEELDTISTRQQDPFVITEEEKKLYKEFIEPYWRGKSFIDLWKARVPEDIRQLTAAVAFENTARTKGGPGILVPNYDLVLKIGINGIRKKINDKLASLDATAPGNFEKKVYLNALLIVCDGIEIRSKRYARLAKEEADKEKDPRRKAELKKIAEMCQHVPANPARNFWEALQSMWLYHCALWMEHNSTMYGPGRMDQYIYPFYKRDIEAGRITKEQAQELLECLWVKFSELIFFTDRGYVTILPGYAAFQGTSCGGVTEYGKDAVNEISYMMLQATMDVRLNQPHLAVKYNKKNPDSFLRKVVELVSLGTGHPPIHNDEVGIKYMMDKGIPFEEAYNWSPRGCYETGLVGKTGNLPQCQASVNMGAAVELAMFNGVNRLTSTRLPVPQTGDPRNFKTFEEFKEAVKTQLAYLIKKAAEAGQIQGYLQQEYRPILVNSLSVEDCIENARDCNAGGAKYNPGSEMLLIGVADIFNSLTSIKKLIYEEKKLTWDELLEALDKDFEGYEEIREMCLSVPKYGNDIPEIDEIAMEITRFGAEQVRQYKGLYGGSRRSPMSAGAGTHILHGKFVGALPCGRKAWQPLSDGISPMQGTDMRGPTAVLKSVSRCCHDLYTSGMLLNMKLDPSIFKDERGIRDFMSLLKAWHDLGMYHVQFNVVSPETLRDAQEHPEQYRGLMVRVSGYSAYFVELAKNIQDDIIARTTFVGLA